MTDEAMKDHAFMAMALRLASRGLGRVAPNPAVGCLLVKNGHIIARGWTQPGGRPHAEQVALERVAEDARGATAYVTLEPCAHYGRTPPCAKALIRAGVARVVVALEDPDPRTAGKGLAALTAAGLETRVGVLADKAERLNRGFLLKVCENRPLVSLKIAQSLDGRIASATGHSQWITGEDARGHGHLLRARHDAILIGSGTYYADHPRLDCRLPGLSDRTPQRVLLCSRPPDSVPPGWWYTQIVDTDQEAADAGEGAVLKVPAQATRTGVSIPAVLRQLADRGITRLLVEGGAGIATAFLRENLVDRLYLYTAPLLIGGDGKAAVGLLDVENVTQDSRRFHLCGQRMLGNDQLHVYERA